MVLVNLMIEDQAQENSRSATDLASEIIAVFSLIREYRVKRNSALENPKRGRVKGEGITKIITVLVLLAIAVILLSLKFLPESTWGVSEQEIRRTLQFMVLFVYVMGAITFIFQYITVKNLFSNLTGKLIDIAEEVTKDHVVLFKKLDSFSTESISHVAKRLAKMVNQLGSMRSFLLGAIERVGIIPGLLATLIAINKIPSSGSFFWAEHLSFVFVVMYVGLFPLASAAFKLDNLSSLLNQYLEQSRGLNGLVG